MAQITKEDLISFVILTYRNFSGIYETLDSLFIQDYPYIELIISDDCSPNASENLPQIQDYIEANKRENIVNVILFSGEENVGTVKNVNRAYRMANGKYIKDLGAEDTLRDSHTLSQYKEFLDESGCLICFSKLQGITEDGQLRNNLASCEDNYDLLRSYTPLQLRDRLFRRNCLPAPAFFAKKELFETYGYFHEEVRLIEDYPYWLDLCTKGVKIAFMDDKLINYKLSGISSAGHFSKAFMDDMIIIYKNYIFPYDRRFGVFQPFYNLLKKMGLNAYIAIAEWDTYSIRKKVTSELKYGIFFLYIKLGDMMHSK